MAIRITTAPESYDGFGTKTLEMLPEKHHLRGQYRKVDILEQHLDWQESRYISGLHASYTEEDFSNRRDGKLLG